MSAPSKLIRTDRIDISGAPLWAEYNAGTDQVFPYISRQIRCVGAGVLTLTNSWDHTDVPTTFLAGEALPLEADGMKASGTTVAGKVLVMF